MIKDFGLAAAIIILNHFVYGVEDQFTYDYIVDFFIANKTGFLAGGIIGSILLVMTSYMFENFGLYKISYGFSKVFVRASQFLIMFLSLINMAFYITIGANIMRDEGYFMLFVLFALLGASCMSLRIIDFNYHTKNAVIPITVFAAFGIILVEFIWPMTM